MLVDLPGYGYAKVSKEERASWGRLTETYLNSREELDTILLLVDIRHDPTEDDIIMLNYIIQSQRNFAIVATKADKIPRSGHKKQIQRIREVLKISQSHAVIPFSSLKRIGIEEIWAEIESKMK